jgi:DNA invertase Pin-like site-specific DNA recombinase
MGSAATEIKNRPVFKKLMQEELQPNDLLMVTKIEVIFIINFSY